MILFWIGYGLILLLVGIAGYYYKKWQYEILEDMNLEDKNEPIPE